MHEGSLKNQKMKLISDPFNRSAHQAGKLYLIHVPLDATKTNMTPLKASYCQNKLE